MIIKIDNQTHLAPLTEIPGAVLNQVRARLTFDNPAYLEAERRVYGG